ncbi:MAG: hypothetical protein K2X35_14730 [Bryobacteraceae bacterium]|nr:hypothetical protein [Bryobacteraceae bacterium]
MARAHLFEFNDQPWLPDALRDALRAYLRKVSDDLAVEDTIVPPVRDALRGSGADCIVDLASGAGGPMLSVARKLNVRILLTDLFPPHVRSPDFYWKPVNALDVPPELTGLRTLVNGFHHFRPDAARRILDCAVRNGQPVAIFELSRRSALTILTSPLIVPIVLLTMFRVRPVRWEWLLLTYLIPVIPLLIFWDGLVSHCRAYTIPELLAMTAEFPAYRWEAGETRLTKAPATVTWLTGWPASPSRQ